MLKESIMMSSLKVSIVYYICDYYYVIDIKIVMFGSKRFKYFLSKKNRNDKINLQHCVFIAKGKQSVLKAGRGS